MTSLDPEGNLLCRAADEISRDVRLSDEALAALLERYGVRQATELILCVSYFNMLSRFLESTRVELEQGLREPPALPLRDSGATTIQIDDIAPFTFNYVNASGELSQRW